MTGHDPTDDKRPNGTAATSEDTDILEELQRELAAELEEERPRRAGRRTRLRLHSPWSLSGWPAR